MKDFFVNIWIIIIIAVVVVGAGLGLGLGLGLRGGAPAEGQVTMELQSYSVDGDGLGGVAGWATGDQWVYSAHMPMGEMGTYDGRVTWTVTGDGMIDGIDCYNASWAFDPAQWEMEMDIDGMATVTISVDSFKMWLEKETTIPKKMEMEFTATVEEETHSFKMVETYSNSVTGTMWPLAVGNEATVTTNGTSWFYMDGELVEEPTPIPSMTITTVVKAEEDVTVAAGTFHCFKIVSYDDGNAVTETWYSTDVKNEVKEIAYL